MGLDDRLTRKPYTSFLSLTFTWLTCTSGSHHLLLLSPIFFQIINPENIQQTYKTHALFLFFIVICFYPIVPY